MTTTHTVRQIDPAKVKAIIAAAYDLVGIHEDPPHSNGGEDVHRLQASTGAYDAPWCVSTGQHLAKLVYGHTLADDTANAYYFEEYAQRHGWCVPRARPAAFVVYHIGQGHFGTVVAVRGDGTFDAVEGNSGDAVRVEERDPRAIRCTFICPPDLYHTVAASHTKSGVTYYTYKRDVPIHGHQVLHFRAGEGYYAADKERA